ncbi:MAG: Xaa-Pro peptidase family protein [Gemmatimonadaceae bacterium]|nr:Xaa-Pro peptidase family protein [Gemmatimonadaceae bacterium]
MTSITRRCFQILAIFSTLSAIGTLAGAQIATSEYATRRAALAERLQNGILVALGSPEPEEDYISFNQNSPFRYLTGFNEPEGALVMVIRNGAIVGTPMLFVQPSDPAREVWTGHRLGLDGVKTMLGFDGRPFVSLGAVVDTLLSRDTTAVLRTVGAFNPAGPIMTRDDQIVGTLIRNHVGTKVDSANADVRALRRVKSAAEQDFIRRAVNVTVGAQRDAMRLIEPGVNEFEVQALIEYDFRRNGADRPSFSTIVGSGPNSTTLHYNADDRFIEKDDIIVMDIGASYRGYAADVTRSVPASGTFSPVQRDIYTAVRAAQASGERAAIVNGPGHAMTDSAVASLGASLTRLGLIEAPSATYDCDVSASRQCAQRLLYYMHGLGHGIGLDVHDPGSAPNNGTLVPGTAFTIEPGIYVRGNLLDIIPNTPKNQAMIAKIRPAVQKYANIGVRIEDDYMVTPAGVEWISRAPREMAEIEAIMKEKWSGPAPRDAATVEAYRSTGRRVP